MGIAMEASSELLKTAVLLVRSMMTQVDVHGNKIIRWDEFLGKSIYENMFSFCSK